MSRKLKLIWDFFGSEADATAKHHAIHLDEFAKKESLTTFGSGIESIDSNQSIAYLIVEEKDMIAVRDALRPKRGEWIEN